MMQQKQHSYIRNHFCVYSGPQISTFGQKKFRILMSDFVFMCVIVHFWFFGCNLGALSIPNFLLNFQKVQDMMGCLSDIVIRVEQAFLYCIEWTHTFTLTFRHLDNCFSFLYYAQFQVFAQWYDAAQKTQSFFISAFSLKKICGQTIFFSKDRS